MPRAMTGGRTTTAPPGPARRRNIISHSLPPRSGAPTGSASSGLYKPLRPTLEHFVFTCAVCNPNQFGVESFCQRVGVLDVYPGNLNGLDSSQIELPGIAQDIE